MKSLKKRNVLFAVCLILFLTHRYLEKIAGIRFAAIDNYLDPLLVMPLLLHMVVEERKLIFRTHHYAMPISHVFGFFILICLLGEVVFPVLSPAFVPDWVDIFFYAVGGAAYTVVNFQDISPG